MTLPKPCTCGETPHAGWCELEVERKADAEELLAAVLERMKRRASGVRIFRHESHALAWYFQTREAWASPKALPLARGLEGGDGTPNRGADDPKRRAFAAIAWAMKLAAQDAEARDAGAGELVARWLFEHHGRGRAYAWIQEGAGGRYSLDQMKRRMSRAHRVIRERLAEGGFLE